MLAQTIIMRQADPSTSGSDILFWGAVVAIIVMAVCIAFKK